VFYKKVACVASVSVLLSAGLKHFSLLERAKIGAKREKRLERAAENPTETLATQANKKGTLLRQQS